MPWANYSIHSVSKSIIMSCTYSNGNENYEICVIFYGKNMYNFLKINGIPIDIYKQKSCE